MMPVLTHIARHARLAALLWALAWMLATPGSSATLNFTGNASEPVTVTGTPRIAIDVGGATRYATYSAGSGTNSLSFSYTVQPGDFDANGIAITSPLDLNGGTLTDLAGNPPTALTFTLPDTSAIKVQTYTAAFTTSPITEANANAVSFTIAKAPTGASFSYTITSSGGAGTVIGSGTISGVSHTVSNVDVSALPAGTLTLSVTVSTAAGGTGAAKTGTSTPTFTGVLDSLSATTASFSVRRLRGGYTGALLRVRRSTDNAQQDIGATVAGNLDTTKLTSFCGAASCYVSAWFDQSGNARDAAQATSANQPRIVNAGSIDMAGGRPSLIWPSVANSTLLLTAAQFTIAAVSVVTQYASASTANSSIYMNGALIENYTGTGVFVGNSSNPIELGGRTVGGLTTRVFTGHISEAIMFAGAITDTDRQALERNQGAWFGISVP